MTDFTRTREALRVYDEGKPERDELWEAVVDDASYMVAQAAETPAVEQVILAFFEDTKHINSLDRCKLIHPNDPWLRRLLAKES